MFELRGEECGREGKLEEEKKERLRSGERKERRRGKWKGVRVGGRKLLRRGGKEDREVEEQGEVERVGRRSRGQG